MPKGVYDREAAKRRRDAEGEERAPSRDDGHRTIGSPVQVKVAAHAHKFEGGACIVEGCRVTAAMVSTPGERNVPEESTPPKPKSGVGRICPECGNIETDGRRKQCMRCHAELPKKEKPRPVGETDRPFKVDDDEPSDPPAGVADVAKAQGTRMCRVCGCTDEDCRQCIAKTGKPCHWVDDDLCSACAPEAGERIPGDDPVDIEHPDELQAKLVALAEKAVVDGIKHGFELELWHGVTVEFDAVDRVVRIKPGGNDAGA